MCWCITQNDHNFNTTVFLKISYKYFNNKIANFHKCCFFWIHLSPYYVNYTTQPTKWHLPAKFFQPLVNCLDSLDRTLFTSRKSTNICRDYNPLTMQGLLKLWMVQLNKKIWNWLLNLFCLFCLQVFSNFTTVSANTTEINLPDQRCNSE